MDKEKILEQLKTEKIGKNLIYYDEIDSTQKKAKELVFKVKDGTLICADYQTSGIGTHDRNWYSQKSQNITFTFIVYPKCNIKKLDNLTYEIAEKILEVIYELYNIKLEIKKPNDLILNKRKVGGILTETKISGEIVESLFIGIGINVHQLEFNKEIEEIATSLEKEYRNIKFEREKIIAEILNKLEKLLEIKIKKQV